MLNIYNKPLYKIGDIVTIGKLNPSNCYIPLGYTEGMEKAKGLRCKVVARDDNPHWISDASKNNLIKALNKILEYYPEIDSLDCDFYTYYLELIDQWDDIDPDDFNWIWGTYMFESIDHNQDIKFSIF